jgi:hypothetical protein
MSVSAEVRLLVRQRTGYACEYCGVSETDSGGELTIDHIQPQTKAGSDDPENLVYCCNRCNQYKADYWPESPDAPSLWNPRVDSRETHFLELADGTLHPITEIGAFTLRRLRLNRPALVANRLERTLRALERRLLERYSEYLSILEKLYSQQSELLEEQQKLLKQQAELLRRLIG